jgi:ParB-like chromosome segregation protein Spo0J
MKQYIIDSELEKCLPPLDKDRLQDLRNSLSKGYDKDYPLIVWKGHDIIVDGHHRYTICEELGIEPVISERTFESIEDAILYAIDHQKSRRNLDAGQLAIVGITRFEAEEKINARKRQLVNLKQGSDAPVLVTSSVKERGGESAAIIAEKAGVKKSNIYQVRAVREKGIPELETMIMKEGLSPNFANIIVQNDSREEQKELVKSGIAAVNARAREIKAQRTSQITEEREAAERAKEKAEMKEYKEVLKAQFGDSRYSCSLSSVFEMWCNSCKCAFDIFKPMVANCCPACASTDIEKRDESWYPGKKVD